MKRYELQTDKGRKITWAPSAKDAIAKAETAGFKVIAIRECNISEDMERFSKETL